MNEALFLNGVFTDVLEEILTAQNNDKDLICYLQPYSGQIIRFLEKNDFDKNPSITFYISTTKELNEIRYVTNIVGWDDKRNLINEKEKLAKYNKQIGLNQPIQKQVYFYSDEKETKECVNIIAVKNFRKLSIPFQTGCLIKVSDNTPLKSRTQSGGWSEVQEVPSYLLETTSSAIKEKEDEELSNKVAESLRDSSAARQKRLEYADKKPDVIQIISKGFNRNPDVIAEVLAKANGICERCKTKAPFIRKSNNTPYLEVHHKLTLAKYGDDSVDNAEALCPNCHREVHFGI